MDSADIIQGKKGGGDAGGQESSPGPLLDYGAPEDWGIRDRISVANLVLLRAPQVWAPLLLAGGMLVTVAAHPLAYVPYFIHPRGLAFLLVTLLPGIATLWLSLAVLRTGSRLMNGEEVTILEALRGPEAHLLFRSLVLWVGLALAMVPTLFLATAYGPERLLAIPLLFALHRLGFFALPALVSEHLLCREAAGTSWKLTGGFMSSVVGPLTLGMAAYGAAATLGCLGGAAGSELLQGLARVHRYQYLFFLPGALLGTTWGLLLWLAYYQTLRARSLS